MLTHVWFMAAVIPAWAAVLFKTLLKDIVRVSLYFNRKSSCILESMKLDLPWSILLKFITYGEIVLKRDIWYHKLA